MVETTTSRFSKGLFPVDLFQYYYEFGQEHLSSNVDVTIIIGNFSKSESIHPKLLCMKFGIMINGIMGNLIDLPGCMIILVFSVISSFISYNIKT